MAFEIEFIVKLSLALVFGMLIGIDRKLKNKPLGLKTCSVISIASCLVTIVSIQSFEQHASATYNAIDPMRLAAQIVSGVGFLGAGVILHRKNDVISGLTSAALIWAASGLGIAVGAGFYLEAAFAVLLLIIAVNFIPRFFKLIGPEKLQTKEISIKMSIDKNLRITNVLDTVEEKFHEMNQKESKDITILDVKVKSFEDGSQKIDLRLLVPESQSTTEIYELIKDTTGILTVDIQNL
ncbi:MgtC/SapB family protein [Lacicoccus alkaliphilus]|uniref:Putative Mg2+ transporter-C (MgtC) family protein n=1 Tax=Lacicoccus alkaliphilus DSM 16010 TaxID=1123231 RepID=A0A1M7AA47_9BACL|nr:MgtC/SapB family protein [Salinicoccus alkaliphilus]SHL39516.1 putative Mg2+ transporter-C (MgtC) family protein [Salinicoccus alkaliphilus DSM 16010]